MRTCPTKLVALLSLVAVIAGCSGTSPGTSPGTPSASAAAPLAIVTPGPSPTPTPSPSPTPTATPSPTPTATRTPSPTASAPFALFADQPYALDLPPGWDAINPADFEGNMGAFEAANPELGGLVKAVLANPAFRVAINARFDQIVATLAIPSSGLSLTTLGKELEAGFTIVPGIGKVPAGKRVSVGGHPALHWTIKLSAKAIVGLQYSVTESIYLVSNDREAVMIEFVTMGRPINEKALLGTFRFN